MSECKPPRNETIWVRYYGDGGNLNFVMTSKDIRDFYFLYKVEGDVMTKLGKSRNPKELEDRFGVNKEYEV